MNKPKSQIRQINRLALLFAFAAIVLIIFLPTAEAKGAPSKTNKNMAIDILAGGTQEVVKTVCGTGDYSPAFTYMTGVELSIQSSPSLPPSSVPQSAIGSATPNIYQQNNALANRFEGFQKLLKTIALFWVVILAVARLIKEITDGRDGFECILKMLSEVCIIFILVLQFDKIVHLICELGVYIAQKASTIAFSGVSSVDSSRADEFLIEIAGEKCPTGDIKAFLWNLSTSCSLMFPWICSKVLNIASTFVLLQIILEIGIRRVFAPFAVADIFNEGLKSPGVRYIKKILAAILKLSICVVISVLVSEIPTNIGGGGLRLAFSVITINVTAIGVMFKAGEYANDMLGV